MQFLRFLGRTIGARAILVLTHFFSKNSNQTSYLRNKRSYEDDMPLILTGMSIFLLRFEILTRSELNIIPKIAIFCIHWVKTPIKIRSSHRLGRQKFKISDIFRYFSYIFRHFSTILENGDLACVLESFVRNLIFPDLI